MNFSCFDCNTGREGSHTETRPGGADRASQLSLHIHQKGKSSSSESRSDSHQHSGDSGPASEQGGTRDGCSSEGTQMTQDKPF